MEKMNLFQKLIEARKEIGYLQKDGLVQYKETRYKAITDEKVMTAVRPTMDKYGLVMTIDKIDMTRTGTLTETVITWRITDADNPEDYILIQSAGQGADTQDKGAGKAMTYSRKYALLNTLLIPTGEDPDRISSDELDAKQDLEGIVKAREKVMEIAETKAADPSELIAQRCVALFHVSFNRLTIEQLRSLYADLKGLPNV